jgi:hypothetical protein
VYERDLSRCVDAGRAAAPSGKIGSAWNGRCRIHASWIGLRTSQIYLKKEVSRYGANGCATRKTDPPVFIPATSRIVLIHLIAPVVCIVGIIHFLFRVKRP